MTDCDQLRCSGDYDSRYRGFGLAAELRRAHGHRATTVSRVSVPPTLGSCLDHAPCRISTKKIENATKYVLEI